MISVVFKYMYINPKISSDIKTRVYENMQDCSSAFPGHLRLLPGRLGAVLNTNHSHGLQQVLLKFGLSVRIEFCLYYGRGETLFARCTDKFFLYFSN